jgi:hypothetical protein
MGVSFLRGQQLGRKDLNIYLTNASGHPTNAAEISYSLYDFTTGMEALLGQSRRTPANPSVGEYYASLLIPLDANIGAYRIRWTMREVVGGPLQTVVQEFDVRDRETSAPSNFSSVETDLIRRLRILTRDNCLVGDETVLFDVDGEEMVISLEDLWGAVHGASTSSKVREAFKSGALRTLSVSPEGKVESKRVTQVLRSPVPEELVTVMTDFGQSSMTAGHRVFVTPTSKLEGCKLEVGQPVLTTQGSRKVLRVEPNPIPHEYVYDLTVEDWHNFELTKSRMIVSNSPDRNYRFRPPTHEGTIDQYNRVFGYIWEDEELGEYLERSLDMISAAPPRTPFASLEDLVRQRKDWTTLLLSGASYWAFQALQANWVADEFAYNIGGVSLDLEKSSKYADLKQSASDQFDKMLEKAKSTIKIVKGLQQPKYGAGIRSSFGPFAGRGVLSPAKFLGM